MLEPQPHAAGLPRETGGILGLSPSPGADFLARFDRVERGFEPTAARTRSLRQHLMRRSRCRLRLLHGLVGGAALLLSARLVVRSRASAGVVSSRMMPCRVVVHLGCSCSRNSSTKNIRGKERLPASIKPRVDAADQTGTNPTGV